VFNIADAAITVGVVLLILDSVLSERAAKVGLAAEKS
jgi:signal peptidase II